MSDPYEYATYPSLIYGTWSVHARLYQFCGSSTAPIPVNITVTILGQGTTTYSGSVTLSADAVYSFTISAPRANLGEGLRCTKLHCVRQLGGQQLKLTNASCAFSVG